MAFYAKENNIKEIAKDRLIVIDNSRDVGHLKSGILKQAGELFDVKTDTCDKKLESRKQKEAMENAVNTTTVNDPKKTRTEKLSVFNKGSLQHN